MPGNVYANGRSILHKDDGGTQVAGVPDVCKTPSPGGPVPIPYPNMAMSSDLADGTKKVKIQGAMAAHKSANISKSSGDEPGTVGGVVSNVNRGKMAFMLYSMDVKLEGKNAVRFADLGPGNGNSYNDMYPAVVGGVDVVVYGDDSAEDVCAKCNQPRPPHRMWATTAAVAACKKWLETVEAIAKELIEVRLAWAEALTAQIASAKFTSPSKDVYTIKDLTDMAKNVKWGEGVVVHSARTKPLTQIAKEMKKIHTVSSSAIEKLKIYTEAGKYIPDATKMFGAVLCKCCSKEGKQWHAFVAISGQGNSPTDILPALEYSAVDGNMKAVKTAVELVRAFVSEPEYGRPSLKTIVNIVEQQQEAAVLDTCEQVAEEAHKAITITNERALEATQNPGRYFKKWTLEDVAKEALKTLNQEAQRIYEWHMPATPNLGPPNMGAVVSDTSVKWVDRGHTYNWDRGKDDSNKPFTCAAPKAIKLCQDQGHVPEALCEILYLGPDGEPVKTNPRVAFKPTPTMKEIDDSSFYEVKPDPHKVDHKEIAPHCDTCKELIPKMVCDKEGKDCP